MLSKCSNCILFNVTNEKYADIHFIYDYCDGNTKEAVRKYQLFSTRRRSWRKACINLLKHLMEIGTFPKTRAERPLEQELAEEEDIIKSNPSTNIRRLSNRVNLPTSFPICLIIIVCEDGITNIRNSHSW